MLVEIDETRSDDEAFGFNDSRPIQRLFADRGDLSSAYTNITNRIERGLWVYNSSAPNDNIICGLGGERSTEKERADDCHDS